MAENKCPYYQGVCGIDEKYLCYCSSNYDKCDIYSNHMKGMVTCLSVARKKVGKSEENIHDAKGANI